MPLQAYCTGHYLTNEMTGCFAVLLVSLYMEARSSDRCDAGTGVVLTDICDDFVSKIHACNKLMGKNGFTFFPSFFSIPITIRIPQTKFY
jgi:hypothetical protein